MKLAAAIVLDTIRAEHMCWGHPCNAAPTAEQNKMHEHLTQNGFAYKPTMYDGKLLQHVWRKPGMGIVSKPSTSKWELYNYNEVGADKKGSGAETLKQAIGAPVPKATLDTAVQKWAGADPDPKELSALLQQVQQGERTGEAGKLAKVASEAREALAPTSATVTLWRAEGDLGALNVKQQDAQSRGFSSYATSKAGAQAYIYSVFEDLDEMPSKNLKITSYEIPKDRIVMYHKQHSAFEAPEKEVIVSHKGFKV